MMGWRIRLRNGDEWDLCSRWRKRGYLAAYAGRWRRVKRSIVRRSRRNAKSALRPSCCPTAHSSAMGRLYRFERQHSMAAFLCSQDER